MINQDSDGLFDSEGDDRRELSWTEVEWEKYLAEHEDNVRDYLKIYDSLGGAADRIDEVARRLGWEMQPDDELTEEEEQVELDANFEADWEPYTLHRNPVYIATKALYVSLVAHWERLATQPGRIPPALGLAVQATLFLGRENALQAVQAVDLGDYALAICFFKRALRQLNESLARLTAPESEADARVTAFRDFALPRLFDLREIWLRVMAECRAAHNNE